MCEILQRDDAILLHYTPLMVGHIRRQYHGYKFVYWVCEEVFFYTVGYYTLNTLYTWLLVPMPPLMRMPLEYRPF